MALTHLSESPRERSVLGVTITFKDDTGAAVVPTAATWTLTDGEGVVVNNRSQVPITSLAAQKTIVLQGADLALAGANGLQRQLLVEFVYTSSLGAGLPGKDAVTFNIEPLAGVS